MTIARMNSQETPPLLKTPPSVFTQLKSIMGASFVTGLVYHPLDVLVKRWQKSTLTVTQARNNKQVLQEVLFQSANNKSVLKKILSAYQGFPLGITYKCILLTYIMLCEKKIVSTLEASELNSFFKKVLGPTYSQSASHAAAGALVGLGETFFLPLEILKTQYVTNPNIREKIKENGFSKYLLQERSHLYKTAPIAAIKYSLGLSLFFGVNSAVRASYHTDNLTQAQVVTAAGAGAFANILVTTPLDVIKVRAEATEGPISVVKIFKKTLQEEKLSALFRSLTPKLIFKGGKLALTLGVADIFCNRLKQAPSLNIFGMFSESKTITPKKVTDLNSQAKVKPT